MNDSLFGQIWISHPKGVHLWTESIAHRGPGLANPRDLCVRQQDLRTPSVPRSCIYPSCHKNAWQPGSRLSKRHTVGDSARLDWPIVWCRLFAHVRPRRSLRYSILDRHEAVCRINNHDTALQFQAWRQLAGQVGLPEGRTGVNRKAESWENRERKKPSSILSGTGPRLLLLRLTG